jgi:hypothetical protein
MQHQPYGMAPPGMAPPGMGNAYYGPPPGYGGEPPSQIENPYGGMPPHPYGGYQDPSTVALQQQLAQQMAQGQQLMAAHAQENALLEQMQMQSGVQPGGGARPGEMQLDGAGGRNGPKSEAELQHEEMQMQHRRMMEQMAWQMEQMQTQQQLESLQDAQVRVYHGQMFVSCMAPDPLALSVTCMAQQA